MPDTGVPLSDMDALIAATALADEMTLVTHSTVDLQPVAGLRLIDCLDQYSAQTEQDRGCNLEKRIRSSRLAQRDVPENVSRREGRNPEHQQLPHG